MERGIISSYNRSGYVLVAVLIVTAVGLLFGAGALLLFRYQCQRRIDRQHELEKVYAVRSAANFAKVAWEIPEDGRGFCYQTWSDRNLDLLVKPVEWIFPKKDNPQHLDIANKWNVGRFFKAVSSDQYNSDCDYEYGGKSETGEALRISDLQIYNSYKCKKSGRNLAFRDQTATNGVCWWVNMGMKGKEGWLQEDYGMRFFIYVSDIFRGTNQSDRVRLCVIRDVLRDGAVGCRRGWPLQGRERALVLEMKSNVEKKETDHGTTYVESGKDLYLYEYGPTPRVSRDSISCKNASIFGFQIAGRSVHLFYINNQQGESGGFALSKGWQMSEDSEVYKYFSGEEDSQAGGEDSRGLRVVVEVEAGSDRRPLDGSPENNTVNVDCIEWVRVTPAYQFDISLKSPGWSEYELATVVQKIGPYDDSKTDGGKNPYNTGYSLRSYDTHGTAWKGYRNHQ